MKIWRNGLLVEASGAIDATDRGVLLGDGLFETLAFVDGVAMRFTKHLARFERGASVLGIPVPAASEEMLSGIAAVADAEGITEGAVRMTLLRGSGPRGVLPPDTPAPTLLISVLAGAVGHGAPLSAVLSEVTCRNERSPLSQIKSTNYLDAVLARREAAAAGADDAIMLNTKGLVAEASAANVFCRFGDALVTPPLTDGALPGIMRQCVIYHEGAVERSLSPDELLKADEIFLTSSLSIRAVIQLDGKRIGDGTAGTVATRLADMPRCAQ